MFVAETVGSVAQLTLRSFSSLAPPWGGSSPDGSLPAYDVLSRTSCESISAVIAVSSAMSFLTGACARLGRCGSCADDNLEDVHQKKAMYVNSPLRFCGVSALIE